MPPPPASPASPSSPTTTVKPPSPLSILHSAPTSPTVSRRASSKSLSSRSPSISFAPLPELAPRRRKSSTPLGVANRANMMRRRMRGHDHPAYLSADDEPPVPWIDRSSNGTTITVEGGRANADKLRQLSAGGNAGDSEDPFVILGRLVKGAGKKLFSSGGGGKQQKEAKNKTGGGGHVVGLVDHTLSPTSSGVTAPESTESPGKTFDNPRDSDTTVKQDNADKGESAQHNGVWEEQISEKFIAAASLRSTSTQSTSPPSHSTELEKMAMSISTPTSPPPRSPSSSSSNDPESDSVDSAFTADEIPTPASSDDMTTPADIKPTTGLTSELPVVLPP